MENLERNLKKTKKREKKRTPRATLRSRIGPDFRPYHSETPSRHPLAGPQNALTTFLFGPGIGGNGSAIRKQPLALGKDIALGTSLGPGFHPPLVETVVDSE